MIEEPLPPALMTLDAAAAFLGLSRSSLARLARDGRVVSVRPFKERRFRRADLEAFVAGLEPARDAAHADSRSSR